MYRVSVKTQFQISGGRGPSLEVNSLQRLIQEETIYANSKILQHPRINQQKKKRVHMNQYDINLLTVVV